MEQYDTWQYYICDRAPCRKVRNVSLLSIYTFHITYIRLAWLMGIGRRRYIVNKNNKSS